MSPKALERIARLAAHFTGAPLVVLTSADAPERPRMAHYRGEPLYGLDHPFFAHVAQAREMILVADLGADPRFAGTPLTIQDAVMRFGAGVPLLGEKDAVLGTLCVFDTHPRILGEGQRAALGDLAALAAVQEAARHRLGLEQALVSLSHAFVADVDLGYFLEVLGRAVDVDRAYLFQLRMGGRKMDNTHEWCAPGIQPQIDDLQDLDTALFPWWMQQLRHGEVISVADVEAMPEQASTEQALLKAQDIRAVLVVPILLHDGDQYGFVGFDDTRRARAWFPEDIRMLRVVGDMVTTGLARKQAEEALRESEERWRRLVQRSPEAILIQVDDQIVYVNDAGCALFEAAAAEVYTRPLSYFVLPSHHDLLAHHLAAANDAGQEADRTYPLRTLDDNLRYVEIFAEPMTYEGQRAVEIVLRDVTRRKYYEEHLIASKERAEEMSRFQASFLADMSHEIRTPLTAIIGFADVLAREVATEQREFAELIARSGRRLMETITSVLEFARLERHALPFSLEQTDLAILVPEVIDMFRPQARQQGLDLRLEIPQEERVEALLDPAAFSRVLINLVSNAIKFTRQGHVTVTLRAERDTVAVTVEDTGVGISPAFMEHLFEEFRQEASEGDRDRRGSGLGLAITKRLVERMGGEITVQSEQGKGSTFTVRFPRHLPVEQADGDDLKAA